MLFGDFDSVADVVAMTVSNQHGVYLLYLLFGGWTRGVVHDPWVDDDGFSSRGFDAKCGVPKPRELNAFQVHSFAPAAAQLEFSTKPSPVFLNVGGSLTLV